MKFIKGMVVGTMIAAGVAMMYSDGMMNRRKIMKKGREVAKKIGIV